MAAAIQTEKLTKTYRSRAGAVNVVDGIDLEVEEGGWVGVTLQLSQTWVAGSRVFDLSNLVTFH